MSLASLAGITGSIDLASADGQALLKQAFADVQAALDSQDKEIDTIKTALLPAIQGIAQIGALAGKLASGAVIAISVPGLSDPVEIRLK
jgi:hypothetical protein